MISEETIDSITTRLSVYYSGRFTIEQGSLLGHFFNERPEVTDDLFELAVRRHLSSWESPDGSTNPPGRFPPTPADLEAHLQHLLTERRRVEHEAKEKERLTERDSHGARVLKKLDWSGLSHNYTGQRNQMIAVLKRHLGLDLMRNEDCQVLWEVQKQWMKAGRKFTEQEVLDIASRFQASQQVEV